MPTPEGPRKMNEPIGRRGSLRPERGRRIARATALTASSWLTTVLCSSSSSCEQALGFLLLERVSGTPVIFETTSAMTSSSTVPIVSFMLLAPLLLDLVLLLAELVGVSRSSAAFS